MTIRESRLTYFPLSYSHSFSAGLILSELWSITSSMLLDVEGNEQTPLRLACVGARSRDKYTQVVSTTSLENLVPMMTPIKSPT